MIGVAQNDLGLNLFAQLVEVDAFYTSTGADWHEDRSKNLPMIRGEFASAGIRLCICMLKFKFHV